jgi:hypothetical protein
MKGLSCDRVKTPIATGRSAVTTADLVPSERIPAVAGTNLCPSVDPEKGETAANGAYRCISPLPLLILASHSISLGSGSTDI